MNKILLSEPYLDNSEVQFVTKSIKNWVSTAGNKISKFEKKFRIIQNLNIL